jgi:Xaa-Pro dipeptidase
VQPNQCLQNTTVSTTLLSSDGWHNYLMITTASAGNAAYPSHLRYVKSALEQALEVTGREPAVVISAGLVHRIFQDDQTYPFKANPWFLWLAPLADAVGSLIVLQSNLRPRLLFVAPDDYWHAPPIAPEGTWTRAFDIDPYPDAKSARDALIALPAHTVWLGEDAAPVATFHCNPADLIAHLEQARARKTAYELACLREASHRGARGHIAARKAFLAGASEFDIHLTFLQATQQEDAALPYGNIVALNENAATLHYQLRSTRAPTTARSLLIDAGAAHNGYASDITRSWAQAGDFADLIDGMHALQQNLCAAIKPGIDWRDLHLEAHRQVAVLLLQAGLLRDISAETAVAQGITQTFLPHGLGHLLGLQVHDVGGFKPDARSAPIARPAGHSALRLTRKLVEGMVVTVEPGLYFIGSLLEKLHASTHAIHVDWPQLAALKPFGGIRIEDNVAVTASGYENLTRAAFSAELAG